MHARRLIAREDPVLHNPSADSDISLSADELEALLEKAGRPERVIASRPRCSQRLASPRVAIELTRIPQRWISSPDSQQPRHFAASGNVIVHSTLQDHSMRQLQTSQLDLDFVSAGENDSRIDRATAEAATMEWNSSAGNSSRQDAETMRLKGQLLDGRFDQAGALRELRGSGSVEVQKRAPGDAADDIQRPASWWRSSRPMAPGRQSTRPATCAWKTPAATRKATAPASIAPPTA